MPSCFSRAATRVAAIVVTALALMIIPSIRIENRAMIGKSVQAMSTNASQRKSPVRAFAFGDSLTAGTSGYQQYPYAPHLERKLQEVSKDGDPPIAVRHLGLPGWTAKQMLQELENDRAGLRAALRRIKDPSVSLVIVLAGTNDMGHGFDADEITRNIQQLHQVCWDEGVPRTVAIGIPPSGYQHKVKEAAELAATISSNLEAYADKHPDKLLFHPFPFPYVPGGENWNADTLHFSPRGYQVLGESLMDVVLKSLNSLEER